MKFTSAAWIVMLSAALTVSAYSQTNGPPASVIASHMLVPDVFENTVPLTGFSGVETGNLLSYGIKAGTAYNDNVLPGESLHPIADFTYTLRPFITLNQQGSRLSQQFRYSPGFTIYQRTSSLNDADQHLTENLNERISPNLTLSIQDNLEKSSNAFSQQLDTSQLGLPLLPISSTVALYADQLSNAFTIGSRYQLGENSLAGATGSYSLLHYEHPEQVEGLANNDSVDASSYFLHRIAERHYMGAIYKYTLMTVSPPGLSDLQIHIHAIAGSYAFYFTPFFQISLIVGPQHLQLAGKSYPQYDNWKPWAQANISWKGRHVALTGNFSRAATTGGGQEGLFETDTVGLNGSWQPTLRWTLGASGGYIDNHAEATYQTALDGHGYSASLAATRRLSEHWNLQFQFDRLSQSYPGVAAITGNAFSDRESISIIYSIQRHLAK